MRIVTRTSFRNGRKCKTVQTMSRHLRCLVLYLRSASFNHRDQYPIGLVVLSCCACNTTHPPRALHSSVPKVMCPVNFGSVRTSSDMDATFLQFMNFNSSSLRLPNGFGWAF